MRILPVLIIAATLAAPAVARERVDLATRLKDRVADKPQSCINLRPGLDSEVVDRAIIYRQSSRLWYVNRPDDGQCTNLDDRHAFISRTPSTQLCRGDIIQIVDPPLRLPLNSCVMGDFVPYRRAK